MDLLCIFAVFLWTLSVLLKLWVNPLTYTLKHELSSFLFFHIWIHLPNIDSPICWWISPTLNVKLILLQYPFYLIKGAIRSDTICTYQVTQWLLSTGIINQFFFWHNKGLALPSPWVLNESYINPEWTQIPWSWVGTTYSTLNHMQGSIREVGWGDSTVCHQVALYRAKR